MTSGNYSLVVSGFSDAGLTGQIFSNETELLYDSKQVSVFIITSKPFYNKGETGWSIRTTFGCNESIEINY